MHDLTLGDATQEAILKVLGTTERLLASAATSASGRSGDAEIWALPDLGLPHNVRRIHGGFFTGALYQWESNVPIVPVDATVNVCTVSVYRLTQAFQDQAEFDRRVARAMDVTRTRSSYIWNFDSGNHFITCAHASGTEGLEAGDYLVLHSSASEYKRQDNGLYPVAGNWFMHGIKMVHDNESGRNLRYIEGRLAEDFHRLASMLVEANRSRHRFFASILAGPGNLAEEVLNHPHYGMPSPDSVAIGCQWFSQPSQFLLLTGPRRPFYFVQSRKADRNLVDLSTGSVQIYPHGLGKQSDMPLTLGYEANGMQINGNNYELHSSLEDDTNFSLRDLEHKSSGGIPANVSRLLSVCPGDVVSEMKPTFSYNHGTRLYDDSA